MSDPVTIRHTPYTGGGNADFRSGVTQLKIFGALAVLLYAAETAFTCYAIVLVSRLQAAILAQDQGAIQATANQMIALGQYEFLDYVLVIGAIAAFFAAMYGPRKAMLALGRSNWQYGYGWTAGSIIVPFWNFYRPWVGLGEIDRVVTYGARTGKTDEGSATEFSNATVALGVVFIIGGIVIRIMGRLADGVSEPTTRNALIEQLTTFQSYAIFMAAGFATITAVFAFYLCRQIVKLREVARAFNLP